MEHLAAEFYDAMSSMAAPAAALDDSRSGSQLQLEIVSAKGLALPLESREALQMLQVSVLFRGECRWSAPVACSSHDPLINFNTEFNISRQTLLDEDNPMTIYLSLAPGAKVEQTPCGLNSCCRTVICSAAIDSRLVCLYGGDYVSVELLPCENDGLTDQGAGSLFVKLSLTGKLAAVQADWDVAAIEQQLESYQDRLANAHRDNFQAAKSWFARCKRDFPFLESRKIKMVAEDECGRHRFVCGFVSPQVTCPRSVDGPRFAARFASLVPFKRDISLSGERVTTWHSAYGTAVRMAGDVEDHAVLLCSLLLGWGMDAYVCSGTIYEPAAGATAFRQHYWVVTLDDVSEGRVVFWESLTGQQYNVPVDARGRVGTVAAGVGEVVSHPFRDVYSLFRHDAFLVNIQTLCSVASQPTSGTPANAAACFDVSNAKCWARFPFRSAPELLRHPGASIALSELGAASGLPAGGPATSVQIELALETAIRNMIVAWRSDAGLQTRFDPALAMALQPALAAYELDRAVSVTFGNQGEGFASGLGLGLGWGWLLVPQCVVLISHSPSPPHPPLPPHTHPTTPTDFQASIKSKVSRGECFKAYPTCFCHTDTLSITTALRHTATVRDIALARSAKSGTGTHSQSAALGLGEGTRLAVRVRVFPYPEGTCSCWVMVASVFEGN